MSVREELENILTDLENIEMDDLTEDQAIAINDAIFQVEFAIGEFEEEAL